MRIGDTIEILQVAVGPVILVSGVGLLLLTMTNRLARVADRCRELARVLRACDGPDRERAIGQLHIFRRRAVLLRRAIELATVSVLLAAVMVIVLFLSALLNSQIGVAMVTVLFVGCMISLIGALAFFIRDIGQTLAALDLELGDVDPTVT